MKKKFKRNLDSLEQVFQFTERFFSREEVEESARFSVNFSIEELFTNMVKYNKDNPNKILLKVELKKKRIIEVCLSDFESQPFDVTTVAPADTTSTLAERKPGGLGLHLIRKMVDTLDYHYENGCSTITFTKLLGQGNV